MGDAKEQKQPVDIENLRRQLAKCSFDDIIVAADKCPALAPLVLFIQEERKKAFRKNESSIRKHTDLIGKITGTKASIDAYATVAQDFGQKELSIVEVGMYRSPSKMEKKLRRLVKEYLKAVDSVHDGLKKMEETAGEIAMYNFKIAYNMHIFTGRTENKDQNKKDKEQIAALQAGIRKRKGM